MVADRFGVGRGLVRVGVVLVACVGLLAVGVGPVSANVPGAVVAAVPGVGEWLDTGAGGPGTESIVQAPGSEGFWAAFSGVGVRSVYGAAEVWSAPPAGTSSELASNAGGIVVPNLGGSGFWVVTEGGVISAFGGAGSICSGSMGGCGTGFSGAVVAAAAVPGSGGGFWVINDDGRVFGTPGVSTFGDWTDGGHVPVALVATPSGKGYYILESDGGISTRGDAVFFGAGRNADDHTWAGMALSLDGSGAVNGYWTITMDGTLYPYGAAQRYGYDVLGLDQANGPVRSMAANKGGDGFAVLQQAGQVNLYPVTGAQADTTEASINNWNSNGGGSGATKPVSVTFGLTVRNESSQEVGVVPYTSGSTDPRSGGTGFSSSALPGYPVLPTKQAAENIAAGASSATWPVTAETYVSGLDSVQTPAAAAIQFDVTPVSDPSDRQRAQLSLARQSIMQQFSGSEIFSQLLGGPVVGSVGSGSLVFSVVESAGSGSFSGGWTLVIGDAAEPSVGGVPVPTVTQLSAPFDAGQDSGQWAFLAEPIYRVDVPGVTKTWSGGVPGRVDVEPVVVTAEPGGQVLGSLMPVSVPSVDQGAGTVTFGAASFYFQQFSSGVPAESLAFQGGWSFPDSVAVVPLDSVTPRVVPAGTNLSTLMLSKSTQNTPVVPMNGLGAQQGRLSVQNNDAVIAADDESLGWLYDRVFFLDADGALITGLDTGDPGGYAAVSTVPALQTVSSEDVSAAGAGAGAEVWVSSTQSTASDWQAAPTLSVQIADGSGGGSTVNNFSSAGSLTYATYNPLDGQMSGDLTSGVGLECAVPGGGQACRPTYPSIKGVPGGSGALYRDATETVRLLTEYHVLQAGTDTSTPDTAVLGMFDGRLTPNANQNAILVSPPSAGQLPPANQNPLFSVQLITPGGTMVDGTAHLATPASQEEAPRFSADDPPSAATVGSVYAYTFAAVGGGVVRYEVRSGALPPGLSLDPATGVVSGVPERVGEFTFRVSAIGAGEAVTEGGWHVIAVIVAAGSAGEGSSPAGGAAGAGAPAGAGPGGHRAGAGVRGGLASTGAELPFGLVGAGLLLLLGGLVLRGRLVRGPRFVGGKGK